MTSFPEIWYLQAIMVFVMALGGIISYYSLLAARHSGQRSPLHFGLGFLSVSVGAGAAGVIYEVLAGDLLTAWVVCSGVMMVGFILILLALCEGGPYPSKELEPEESREPK